MHTRARTHRVHGRRHTARSVRAGSSRVRGLETREPRRGVPPGRAGTKDTAGRGRPGRAAIGGWGRGGEALPGADWPRPQRVPRSRPAPRDRNRSSVLPPRTRPRPGHLRRGRDAGRSRIPAQPPSTGTRRSQTTCAPRCPQPRPRPDARGLPRAPAGWGA